MLRMVVRTKPLSIHTSFVRLMFVPRGSSRPVHWGDMMGFSVGETKGRKGISFGASASIVLTLFPCLAADSAPRLCYVMHIKDARRC